MFLFRKPLSRRAVLKGAGVTIALPLLDAMIPARTMLALTAAAPSPRLGFVYFPHGALQDEWQPKAVGRDFDFPFILKPLEPLTQRLGRLATPVLGQRRHVERRVGRRRAEEPVENPLTAQHR